MRTKKYVIFPETSDDAKLIASQKADHYKDGIEYVVDKGQTKAKTLLLNADNTIVSNVKTQVLSKIYGAHIKGILVTANKEKEYPYQYPNQNTNNIKYDVSGEIPLSKIEYETQTGYAPDSTINGTWDGKMSSSLSGMPVYCHCKILGGTYSDYAGNSYSFESVDLETVVISLKQNKLISKTDIIGRYTHGSVKEIISMGDNDIEIRAIVTKDAPLNGNVSYGFSADAYPYDNMAELNKIIQAPISLKVECMYLNQFGIEYIVIENADISQVEGEYSMQRIVLSCISDTPLTIKVARP